jgi:iron complex transport system substrate-binding protein
MRLRIGVVTFALCACCTFAVWATEPIELTDQAGVTVTIVPPVERLVSVYGSGTFSIYALGAGDRLAMAWYVGVRGIAQASEALRRLEPRLEDILNFGDPNVEEMIARDADLILVDGSRYGAFADQMNELGVPTLQLLVETPEALMESLALLGRALGEEATQRAAALSADYDRVTTAVQDSLADLQTPDRVRVLFLGTDPLTVASGDMYQTLLIEAAGGVSVTEDLVGYWNEVNLEQVLLWNPDVIVIPPYGPVQPEDLTGSPDWQAVRAVQTGRVHRMPRVLAPMDTPVPESVLGVLWMADILYPGCVALDLADEARRFYATYYDYALTDAEIEQLTSP